MLVVHGSLPAELEEYLAKRICEKFPFYAGRGVLEILVIDPVARAVRWFARDDLAGSGFGETRLVRC